MSKPQEQVGAGSMEHETGALGAVREEGRRQRVGQLVEKRLG